ncbi:028R [Cherax quadricarinatus iridovirus]|uniref:Thiol reductase thioredoxin n=1 Tax=Shrimp hemocyte iridescent virus TaxID=2039780 RepID=A0A291B0X5_9VIRU|nr:028R [Cherax quadricarinatus iridovirus]YP_010084874.1 thiol reductase thioredoxin [Shrimp hemocyte iridescent virus]UPA43348.1 thiol reductase thioredoxin [Iridovirus CN01]ASZ85008.1 028R [Cherax quadricarinatus iridovirus]ATE87131.1 thiol reductase thioredoxin [Shrimp hemocyte iridescent virus]UPA43583.1 thiol reductase thioredoxin [Iridovirus CN01]UPA43618.1 thiol reductase thioredoxin [Iridovirus CN01]
MSILKYPIGYLERQDFSENGDLVGDLGDKPVFIMIQAGYCGACTDVKPEFQKLANEGIITTMTIQIDGDRDSEKEIADIIQDIYPGVSTIPSFILYTGNERIKYTGQDRSYQGLKNFVLESTTV